MSLRDRRWFNGGISIEQVTVETSIMSFTYQRTVRLADTDAAGVVYFSNVLTMCHEAYEQALIDNGINWKSLLEKRQIAIPIVHASVDLFQPLYCGEQVSIQISPEQLNETDFEIIYHIMSNQGTVSKCAQALTKHVCINPDTRQRTALPEIIVKWLKHT